MKLEKVEKQVFLPLVGAQSSLHFTLNAYMKARTAFEKDPNSTTYTQWDVALSTFKQAHFEWKKLFRTLNEGKRL